MTEPERDFDHRRRRILWRATHRGTQETDRMVGGYVAPRLGAFTEAELNQVETILDLPDVDLADWLSGRAPIPDGLDLPMLHAMRRAVAA